VPRELSFIERRDWLRLIRTQNVGPVAFRDLINRYGDASSVLNALPSLIRKKPIHPPSADQVEAEMNYAEEMGLQLICAIEPDYPQYLRALDPPPPVIAVWGRIDILHRPCVAIIGSRNASAIGQRFANGLAAELGHAGYTVVSGLARGIDTAAHRGALDTGTIAVLGGGVDHIYPRENTELHAQIVNREVMAAPGSPLDPRTKGCNRLIRQGAHLIESAEDVIAVLETLRALDMEEPKAPFGAVPFDVKRAAGEIAKAKVQIANLLSPTPTSRDDIIRTSHLSVPIVTAALLEMELAGDVLVEPDGRVSRV